MKFKIVLEEGDMKRISLEQLCFFVKKLNMNEQAEAHIDGLGNNCVEVVISKKNEFKSICDSMGINHFDSREDLKDWLRRQNEKRRNRKRI